MTLVMKEDVVDNPTSPSCPQDIRRCLFERQDADVTRQDLERAWAELRVINNVKWNFDFDRQQPVAGPIVWTRCDDDTWLGQVATDDETTATSVTSSQRAARDHPRRQHQLMSDHTARRVHVKSSRLSRRRRQSRLTGS